MDAKTSLIKTATKLFSEKEYDNVSIREIASKAKLNSSMISYYFKNKEGLYKAIIENQGKEITKIIRSDKFNNFKPQKKLLSLMKELDAIYDEDITLIALRTIMKKKEKEMQKILMDNFLKEVSTEIANIINSCEISKNFKNKISKRQLILFVFLTNKIWLMYSDILLKIMPEIKSKDELKKEVDEMIKTIIEEITE